MTVPDEMLKEIFERITAGVQTPEDIEILRQALLLAQASEAELSKMQTILQAGKYNVNIGKGQEIHIGDRIYITWNEDTIQSLVQELRKQAPNTTQPVSVDDLVQQVRSRLHDNIQRLHGTMPLWGVDHWVPLGDLFVDVNILEELSSSHRSELDDLWRDFSKHRSSRSLDRIGLGKVQKRISGLEILERNTNLMMVGKPGSGKTTYLQRVVKECTAGNLQMHRIPVLIKLRDFVDDGREVAYSLEHYLESYWRLSEAEIRLLLDQGRSLILLDGLDEVIGEEGKTITKQIKRFAHAYPQVQMIVTCRQPQDSRFERFDYVEVASFNEPQLKSFAQHWFKTRMRDESLGLLKAQDFLGHLFFKGNKAIRELATTPILLSLTCAVFYKTGKFYSKRSKLYEEGLELLLEQWDKSREIEQDELYRDLSIEQKLDLLSYLAVKKFEQSQYVLFEQEEIESYISDFLESSQRDSRTILKAIEKQHGLLIERSRKIWSFSHLTFQEYLATRKLVAESNFSYLAKQITKSYWHETFCLALEMTTNCDRLILLVKEEIDKSIAADLLLQNLLEKTFEKCNSIDSNNQNQVRSFYFAINCNKIFDFEPYGKSQKDRIFEFRLKSILEDGRLTDCMLDYEFALLIYNAHCLASKTAMNFPSYAQIHRNFIMHLNSINQFEIEEQFKAELESLFKSLPNYTHKEWESYRDWGQKQGDRWTSKLQYLVIKYRNIRYDFQDLDDSQREKLGKYYELNKFLINLLHTQCNPRENTIKEIEDTMFLPFSEIEKSHIVT